MKNKVLASSPSAEEKTSLWSVHIELNHVRFSRSPELGIDFYNSIDAWRKMEISFRHKISRPNVKRDDQDFVTIHYSVREKIF